MLISSSIVFGQISIVKGTVVDDSGMPMLGATIVVEGTENGVTTDFDGKYTIELSSGNYTLIFSFVGYETKEITNINDLNSANNSEITFFHSKKYKYIARKI